MVKTIKHIPFKDLKDTPYYDVYLKMINTYSQNIIEEVMRNQNNDIKYTWNDVLKQVFKFINGDLKKFPDRFDVNPSRELLEKQELDEITRQQTIQLL